MLTYSDIVSLILCNVDTTADLARLSEDYSVTPVYPVR